MILVSKFLDFYDPICKYDTNGDVVFQRNPIEIKFKDDNPGKLVTEINKLYVPFLNNNRFYLNSKSNNSHNQIRRVYDKNVSYDFSLHLIIFCGKIYPFVFVDKQFTDTKILPQKFYFYSFDAFVDFLEKNQLRFHSTLSENRCKQFFIPGNPHIEFLIVNKVTIALISIEKVSFNISLKYREFYKVLDSYSAYQELDMWMSGVLAYPQNLMIEVDDKSKIQKHGFDKKYGFRKRPV